MHTKTIRGDSERQVELKVQEFISERAKVGEEWIAGLVEYHNARILGWQPYHCTVGKIVND